MWRALLALCALTLLAVTPASSQWKEHFDVGERKSVEDSLGTRIDSLEADVDSLEAGQSGSDEIHIFGDLNQFAGCDEFRGMLGWYERWDSTAVDWSTTAADTLYDANENAHLPFLPYYAFVGFIGDVAEASPANDTLYVIGATADTVGNVTDPDTSIIVFASTDSLSHYQQTDKRFLGDIEIKRISAADSARSTNIITVSPWTNFDTDFTVKKFLAEGGSNGTSTVNEIILLHHKLSGWTFNAAGLTMPGDFPAALFDFNADYGSYVRFVLNQQWGYEMRGIDTDINADSGEGIVLFINTSSNEAMEGRYHMVVEVK
jgi:hypothetical protein